MLRQKRYSFRFMWLTSTLLFLSWAKQNPQFAVIRKTANGFPYYIPRYYFLQEKVTRFEVALLEVSVEAEYDTHFQRWYERALGMVGKDLFPDFKHFRQKTKALITDQADRDPQWIAAFLGEKTSDKKDLILRLVVEMSVEYQLRRLADIKNGVVFEVSVWHDRPYCITLHGLISKIGDLIILWHILNLARHLPLFIHDIEELWFFHWVRPLLSIEQDYVFGRIAR